MTDWENERLLEEKRLWWDSMEEASRRDTIFDTILQQLPQSNTDISNDGTLRNYSKEESGMCFISTLETFGIGEKRKTTNYENEITMGHPKFTVIFKSRIHTNEYFDKPFDKNEVREIYIPITEIQLMQRAIIYSVLLGRKHLNLNKCFNRISNGHWWLGFSNREEDNLKEVRKDNLIYNSLLQFFPEPQITKCNRGQYDVISKISTSQKGYNFRTKTSMKTPYILACDEICVDPNENEKINKCIITLAHSKYEIVLESEIRTENTFFTEEDITDIYEPMLRIQRVQRAIIFLYLSGKYNMDMDQLFKKTYYHEFWNLSSKTRERKKFEEEFFF